MKTYEKIIRELVDEWGAVESDAERMMEAEIDYRGEKQALSAINKWLLDPPIRQFDSDSYKLSDLIAGYRPLAIYISALISEKLLNNINPKGKE
jgi:hypothetical protein